MKILGMGPRELVVFGGVYGALLFGADAALDYFDRLGSEVKRKGVPRTLEILDPEGDGMTREELREYVDGMDLDTLQRVGFYSARYRSEVEARKD